MREIGWAWKVDNLAREDFSEMTLNWEMRAGKEEPHQDQEKSISGRGNRHRKSLTCFRKERPSMAIPWEGLWEEVWSKRQTRAKSSEAMIRSK